MPRYKTLTIDEAEDALAKIKGLEALIVDGKLQAIIAGPLRIYAKSDLIISQQDDAP